MIIIYVTNAIINAVLFGVFVDQFIIIRGKQTALQKEIDDSNEVMFQLGLDKQDIHLKKHVRAFLLRTATTKTLQEELKEFLGERINPDLRSQII